jgi:hypothetical protein
MRDAPWLALVRDLTDEGYESPYLDRLRRRMDLTGPRESLEKEIIREMAASLGRAEDKINVALLRLELAGHALAAAPDPAARRHCAGAFNAERAHALTARWELMIQREAIGLHRNEVLDRLYPIPPPAVVEPSGAPPT